MSENAPEGQSEQHNDGGDKGGFTPPASQADFDRIISERVTRERAKYADHADLKAKAAKFDALEAANLTESEKTANRLAAADAEVATVPAKVADALRTHLVALHEIDADDAELFLTANDPELLLKQVQRLVGRAGDSKKRGNHVPREGRTPTPGGDDPMRDFTRELFDRAKTD